MVDEVNGDSELFDISALSEAEKRRLRRRQRILDNQGARLQRILNSDDGGNNGKGDEVDGSPPIESSKSSNTADGAAKRVDSVDNSCVGKKDLKNKIKQVASKTSNATSYHNHLSTTESEPPNPASLLTERSGLTAQNNTTTEQPVTIGVQSDGTVVLPKLSDIYGRVLICLLAMFLSILNAKRYLITFISWEVAYYYINGLPPMPPPNMGMVLASVMGFNEIQLNRIKKLLHLSNCVMMDFSLFLTFSLVPYLIKDVISL